MRITHRPDVPRTAVRSLIAALIAALAASLVLPVRAAAQSAGGRPLIFDQFVSRDRLDASVAGNRTRLDGIGFRLTRPLAVRLADQPTRLPERLALGGFVTYAESRDQRLGAWHFGAHADVLARRSPVPAPVEPLVSLGVGALRAQLAPDAGRGPSPLCVARTDLARGRGAASCAFDVPREELSARTHLTVTPAAGLRVALGPDAGLRADVRDIIVFRGAARHNYGFAAGLSFVR